MSIEFACVHCGQKLRVSDDSAGKKAKCPKCSQLNEIPSPSYGDADDLRLMPEEPTAGAGKSPFESQSNPYTTPHAGYYDSTTATVGGKVGNATADIGNILNHASAIWQQNLGLLIGATAVLAVPTIVSGVVSFVSEEVLRDAARFFVDLSNSIVTQLVGIFLGIGYTRIMLKLARGHRVEFDELFSGGPLFLPTLGVSILYGLAVSAGFLLCIIPGLIIAVIWWPCYYLVVDQKTRVLDSFGVASEVIRGNVGTIILVFLLGAGIGLLGVLACCVGLLAAVPLASLLNATAYLMMSGQLPLQPAATSGKPFV